MRHKLNDHSRAYQPAGEIRREPAWIANDLENSPLLVLVVPVGLVKCLATITQRIVHEDQEFTVFALRRVVQTHAAGEIFRNVAARVSVEFEFHEMQAERFVKSPRAQRELILTVLERELLRIGEETR